MKTIAVEIAGREPGILFNNPASMKKETRAGKKETPSSEEDAARSIYWNDKKEVCFPADNIKAAMIGASSMYKTGKVRLSPFVAGSVTITPSLISFGTKEYETDTRRAVIQKQGIIRARGKLTNWRLAFEMAVDEDFPTDDLSVLKSILEEAGRRIGIGDFRPQKKGWFGKFTVERFEFKK